MSAHTQRFDASIFRAECQNIVTNFNKLVKGTSPSQPGDLQDIYADKILVSVKRVLEASRALQRRAALSDVGRVEQK
jgi:hypothetical protein